jgi:hypothetical protein
MRCSASNIFVGFSDDGRPNFPGFSPLAVYPHQNIKIGHRKFVPVPELVAFLALRHKFPSVHTRLSNPTNMAWLRMVRDRILMDICQKYSRRHPVRLGSRPLTRLTTVFFRLPTLNHD